MCTHDEADRSARFVAIADEFETYIRTSGVQTDLREEKRRGDARRRARDELRHRRVVLVGSEPKRPYQRPPLSKEHLPQLRARGQLLLPVIEPGPRA